MPEAPTSRVVRMLLVGALLRLENPSHFHCHTKKVDDATHKSERSFYSPANSNRGRLSTASQRNRNAPPNSRRARPSYTAARPAGKTQALRSGQRQVYYLDGFCQCLDFCFLVPRATLARRACSGRWRHAGGRNRFFYRFAARISECAYLVKRHSGPSTQTSTGHKISENQPPHRGL